MAADDFLGRGMKFPPEINKATGRFVVSSGAQSVKESIYLILNTALGERFMRPEFGTNLSSYTFMDLNHTNVGLMVSSLENRITDLEPRIRAVDVEVDFESTPGQLIVSIGYTIAATNTRDNYVFPFYLNTTPEEEEPSFENQWEPEAGADYAIEEDV